MKNTLYLVYPKSSESGTLETLPETEGMKLIPEDDFVNNYGDKTDTNKVCITSEASLESILRIVKDQSKIDGISAMKDKHLFRRLLQEMYPLLGYHLISFEDIHALEVSSKKIIKPIKGCFGTAVKTIDEKSDLAKIAQEIKIEIAKNSAVLSESVLSQSEFIVEDYIEGEEYAVDMFYDSKGQPHIVNIYFHPIPKHAEYLHMVYYTSKSVFEKIYARAVEFFHRLQEKLQLKNIALHAEFRFSDQLIPIEINAMRFGGMGLGNMIYHSLKVNPYQHFIDEKSPDWPEIWKHHPDSNFVYFIAYNGTQIDKAKQKPNLKKLEGEFTSLLNRTIFDYQKQLAFAAYTLQEDPGNIDKLLQIDFNDYYEEIN